VTTLFLPFLVGWSIGGAVPGMLGQRFLVDTDEICAVRDYSFPVGLANFMQLIHPIWLWMWLG